MNKLAIITLALAVGAGACKSKEKPAASLPPATGSGAAPLPEIPEVKPAGGAEAAGAGAAAKVTEAAVTGTLEAREEVSVAPRSSGTLLAISVDENSRVKKGQVLFQLDTRDSQLMKKQAQNQLASAQLGLKTAQREYDRIQGLVTQKALPQQQLDQLEAQVDGAKLQIASAQNSIAIANKAINDGAVRSPLTGVVTKKLLSVGEYATMMPPSPVVIVQDQATLELKFRLPERTLTSVKPGDAVTVTIPSLGETRAAAVARISPMVDARSRTIELTAVLDNCDGGLRPGIAAGVTLGTPTATLTTPACGKTAAGKGKAKP